MLNLFMNVKRYYCVSRSAVRNDIKKICLKIKVCFIFRNQVQRLTALRRPSAEENERTLQQPPLNVVITLNKKPQLSLELAEVNNRSKTQLMTTKVLYVFSFLFLLE